MEPWAGVPYDGPGLDDDSDELDAPTFEADWLDATSARRSSSFSTMRNGIATCFPTAAACPPSDADTAEDESVRGVDEEVGVAIAAVAGASLIRLITCVRFCILLITCSGRAPCWAGWSCKAYEAACRGKG